MQLMSRRITCTVLEALIAVHIAAFVYQLKFPNALNEQSHVVEQIAVIQYGGD